VNTAAGQFGVSDAGTLAYATGSLSPDRQDELVWADHKGIMQPITSFKAPFWAPRLSPDGQRIAYVTIGRDWRTWIYDLRRGTEAFPEFSPDGHWLAYVSDESDRDEVYVRPFPALGAKTQVSTAGGAAPLWSRDGKQLFFRSGCEVWVTDVRITATFSAAKPRLLFKQLPDCMDSEPTRNWDVLEGRRTRTASKPCFSL
jgi:Tol biopolymer transport system component